MNRTAIAFLLCLAGLVSGAYAQEICNNGVDDDNDGRIDCFDADCANNTACDGSYIGNDALCEAIPSTFPGFKMTLDWESPNQTTNHLNRVSIGDLDRDGIPEVVATNVENDQIYVLNGSNGQIKYRTGQAGRVSINYSLSREIAIANINNDACGEIFVSGIKDDKWYIYAYNCDLTTQLWRSPELEGDPGPFGLANFNGDVDANGNSIVELYFRDVILNAHTGQLIANSPVSFSDAAPSSVAVDIVGDATLELVTGLRILSVNIAGGTITQHSRRTEYFVKNSYKGSHTSVADFNLDGSLDIVASGAKQGDTTAVFFWNVASNTLKIYRDFIPGDVSIQGCSPGTGSYYAKGWERGTGRINIGDLDGDGTLNLAYVSGKYLYALKETATGLDTLWRKEVKEETSGYTGCTMFDFNGDGKTEIVYRDEDYLMIIDGTNGGTFTSQRCVARTNIEYPIVADLDADGESEICVTCGFDNNAASANFCDIDYSVNSHVRAYKTDLEPWVPARRVWNQHAYFNVNINDNLTIPRRQQKQQTVFSPTGCGDGRPSRPLNSFLNQSPFLNSQGCPIYAAPNIVYVAASVVITPPTCPNKDFTVSFRMQNIGDVPLSGKFPIAFYKGNPQVAGALKLDTINVSLNNFGVNDIQTVTTTIAGDGSQFTLFVALNHTGIQAPPITFPDPNSTFLECDYNNIFSASVNPNPVALTALKIKDNIKCDPAAPDNGAVRAFIPQVGGVENIADYLFYWSNGASAKPVPADFIGPSRTGLAGGAYTVYARHKTVTCSSDTSTVTVNQVDAVFDLNIVLDNPFTNCLNPNGKLTATVSVGGVTQPVGKYTYAWYEGNDIFTSPQVGVSHVAAGLKPITYTVLVTDKSSGCQSIESFNVPDLSVIPVVSASSVDIICSAANSGSVSANVGGVTAGFKFEWYNGSAVKPTPDFTGATRTNLTAGSYTVVATNNTTKCSSAPVTVTVVQTTVPTVTATAVSPMTSCDASLPNGTASASIGGTTEGFSFEWFSGQNTLPANRVATTPVVSTLSAGIYTVKATDNTTGCFDTDEVTITFNVVTPALTLGTITDNTNCTTPTGAIQVSVSPGVANDYTFNWFNGPSVKPTADFSDTDNVLNNVLPGVYTVQAFHKTNNCVTSPITATVQDNSPIIAITQVGSITRLPTDCNSSDGVMGVNVSAPGNTTQGFRIEWFKNNASTPFLTQQPVFTSTANNLGSAVYTVKATNLANGCSASQQFNLPFADAHILSFVAKTDATTCNPENEGSITVRLRPTPAVIPGPPPVAFTVNDYQLLFYAGMDDTTPPILTMNGSTGVANGDGTSNYSINNRTPGFYTIVAVENNVLLSGCKSLPVTVEILSTAIDPVVSAASTSNNTNCVGVVLANGQIVAQADGNPPAGYSFAWFDGPTTSSPVLSTTGGVNNNTALNLDAGPYTVEVTNTTTLCKTTGTFAVFNNPPIISMANGDIRVDNMTRCDMQNGGAEVLVIRENGVPVPLGGYSFQWFDEVQASIGSGTSITNLAEGNYFVQASSAANNCASALLALTVEDQTIGTVGVSLTGFTNPTQCLKPSNILGDLTIVPTGTSTSGYTINWYNGPIVSGAPVANTPTLSGISIPPGQTTIQQTVEVINNSNQCAVTDTYTLTLNVAEINLTASAASPMTSCIADNGEVFATVTSGSSNTYTYNWYTGAVTKPTPDFTGKQVSNLPVGSYTVEAVDQADNFCVTTPATVIIEDGRMNPVVAAVQTAPLTICDVSRPDGLASASVMDNIVDYTFDWYAGASVAGTPFFTGPQASGLAAIQYTVEATHLITGCKGSASVTITENKLPIPAPLVTVLSQVTTCDPLQNNGMLGASVEGNTSDYIFDWSDGTSAQSPPHFTGEIYDSLDAGIYTVIATSRITGCVSGPAPGEITEDLVYPDFTYEITKATCKQLNALVSLQVSNNVTISSIEWTVNGAPFFGPVLDGIGEGVYPVTVTTSEGCAVSKEVVVGTEIRPFQGISRGASSGGQNDYFHVDCIESFPTNFVKIFNRAGTLVYSAEGYDNISIFFDGQSNRGVSLLGNNLPDGTYFYVIDKNDGSKPLAGYLEIVN
jgi:hypothetical protein